MKPRAPTHGYGILCVGKRSSSIIFRKFANYAVRLAFSDVRSIESTVSDRVFQTLYKSFLL